MSKNICTLTKWFPNEILEFQDLFDKCKEMEVTGLNLVTRINHLSNYIKRNKCFKFSQPWISENEMHITEIENVSSALETVLETYNSVIPKMKMEIHNLLTNKLNMWQKILWEIRMKLCYCIQELINNITPTFIQYGERLLVLTLRISQSFNNLLDIDQISNNNKSIICNNTCPYLIFPQRKISITRLLQMTAHSRAEHCCHKLIDCLLETYKFYDNSDDDNGSDNSSLEIYMTLTKHMSPPEMPENNLKRDSPDTDRISELHNFVNLEELIAYEEKNIFNLLKITRKSAPSMLGHDGVKNSKTSGKLKVSTKVLEKSLKYYEEILWGEVGNYLEHIILWWSASPLSARPPHSSQHLREWIIQFIPATDVSPVVLSALACLADALGVHVNSTSWDQNFRQALVTSKKPCNPESGKLFSTTLKDLIAQCNQCESTPDWIMGAPLDELPLVEQIPILHRLDHSVHMTRIWAVNESKKLSNSWNVQGFFSLIHGDIVDCLEQLNNLRMTDHTNEIEKGNLGVHVEVCALMRAKLHSEVKVNVEKLRDTPKECIDGLATVCKTICLANLQMIFPSSSYWKQAGSEFLPEKSSTFVNKYLNQILVPVLEATDNDVITNMILTLICESWLNHIYTNKIIFSKYGACQLLCDFGYVTTWLIDYQNIGESMRKKLLKNEVLRRCEGVGRLLLRCPGEKIKMTDKNKRKMSNIDPSEADKKELMPAEMYVPNQEQWLELRALKRKPLFFPILCCGKE